MSYQGQNRGSTFMDHLGKWLQLKAFMEEQKYRKEDREQRRQIFQLELEDRNRQRAQQDFATALTLQKVGALPAMPGDTGKNDELIAAAVNITPENRRRLINTPVGSYRLPSETDRYKKGRAAAIEEGTQKGLGILATEQVTDPYEEIGLPAQLGGGTARVKKSDKVSKLLEIYKVARPHRTYHATTPNDKGEVTIWSVDPANGDVRTEKTLTNAGKTARPPAAGAESIPDFDARVKARMDEWRPGHYAQLGITPEVAESAKGLGEAGPFGSSNPAATRISQAENTLYQRAVDSLKNEARGRRVQGGSTSAAPKPDALTAIKNTLKANPGVPMPAKNAALAAQRLGISEEEFSRLWHSAGGKITP